VIDFKSELQNYNIIDLNAITGNGMDIPENIRTSVELYNRAIESLKSGIDDIAVIELKKAVSLNPGFHEAMNLLGLCYINKKDYEKAAEIFNKVIKAESNSIRAMKYLEQMNSGDDSAEPDNAGISKGTKRFKKIVASRVKGIKKDFIRQAAGSTAGSSSGESTGTGKRPSDKKNIKAYLPLITTGLICFIAGILITLMFASGNGSNGENKLVDNQVTNNMTAEQKENKEETDNKAQEEIDRLTRENEEIKKQLDQALAEVKHYKQVNRLKEIESLKKEKKYTEAAEQLLLLNAGSFTPEELTEYEKLRKSIMPDAAKAAYDEGYRLYNSKKYREALNKLLRVQVYDPEYRRMDAVYYYLGRCSQFLDDNTSALNYFQKVVDEYPNSSYVKRAKQQIERIT